MNCRLCDKEMIYSDGKNNQQFVNVYYDEYFCPITQVFDSKNESHFIIAKEQCELIFHEFSIFYSDKFSNKYTYIQILNNNRYTPFFNTNSNILKDINFKTITREEFINKLNYLKIFN